MVLTTIEPFHNFLADSCLLNYSLHRRTDSYVFNIDLIVTDYIYPIKTLDSNVTCINLPKHIQLRRGFYITW